MLVYFSKNTPRGPKKTCLAYRFPIFPFLVPLKFSNVLGFRGNFLDEGVSVCVTTHGIGAWSKVAESRANGPWDPLELTGLPLRWGQE